MLVTAPGELRISHQMPPEPVQVGRAREQARPVRRRPSADCERGRGLELIDSLIELSGGTRGVIDDRDCPGKTVYVTVCLAPDPEGTP